MMKGIEAAKSGGCGGFFGCNEDEWLGRSPPRCLECLEEGLAFDAEMEFGFHDDLEMSQHIFRTMREEEEQEALDFRAEREADQYE